MDLAKKTIEQLFAESLVIDSRLLHNALQPWIPRFE